MHGLTTALARLHPELDPEIYVFVSMPRPRADLDPVASVREAEGTTYVVARQVAIRESLDPAFPCRRISLTTATDLDLVGFLARIATALAEAGIPCNPVAGFHHDHLFVPVQRADQALAVLEALGEAARSDP